MLIKPLICSFLSLNVDNIDVCIAVCCGKFPVKYKQLPVESKAPPMWPSLMKIVIRTGNIESPFGLKYSLLGKKALLITCLVF